MKKYQKRYKKSWYEILWMWIKNPIKRWKRRRMFKGLEKAYREPRPLSEIELKWIFAIKHDKVKEHYDKYYQLNDSYLNEKGELHDYILIDILSPMIDHLENGWKDVMKFMRNSSTIFILNDDKKYSLREAWDEILSYAIQTRLKNIDVSWLDNKKNAPKNWRDIVNPERTWAVSGYKYLSKKEKAKVDKDRDEIRSGVL